MPDETKKVAKRFCDMAETWTIFANSAYQDFANMKFFKKVNGGPGHRSRKEFEAFKRGVYQMHKMYKENAKLCLAVAKELETGEKQDFKIEEESNLKSASKIILGSLNRLKP